MQTLDQIADDLTCGSTLIIERCPRADAPYTYLAVRIEPAAGPVIHYVCANGWIKDS